jgi:HAD superfamily hydrolase (TIGR01509 family)
MNQQIAVIFDMDGVLLNSEPLYFEVEHKLYQELNLPVSREEHDSFVGMSMRKIWEFLIKKYGLEKPVEELIEIHIERMLQLVRNQKELKPNEGISNLIASLKVKNVKIAVATSTVRKLAVVMLDKIGFLHEFDVIVCGDEIANGKPEPDIFLKASQLLQYYSPQCIVIEDSANGVKAAKAAKMKCVGYQNPGSGEQNLQKSDLIISDFRRLDYQKLLTL